MKRKKLFISLVSVLSVILFLGIFLLVWFYGAIYKDFKGFKKEFEIPGLDDGAVPQGMGTYTSKYIVTDEEGKTKSVTQQYFFISAYMADGSPSRIYVVGADTGYVGYVTLKNEDGSFFYGHCGGVATNGYTLWVTGESNVYVAKANEAYTKAYGNPAGNPADIITREIVDKAARIKLNATDSDEDYDFSVKFTASFKANCNASFCYYYDDPSSSYVSYDRLYIGEFYRDGNYKTDPSHHLATPSGYKNTAFMYEYNVTSTTSNKYGLSIINQETGLEEEDRVPKIQKIFSLPEKIQGMAFSGKSKYSASDGMMVLSESYGLANSHLLCFDVKALMGTSVKYNTVAGANFEYNGVTKNVGGKDIPYTDSSLNLYYVDKGNGEMFVNDYSIPSMSEGMCVVTPASSDNGPVGKVYVLFESAGKKYKHFVRTQLKNVYSFTPKAK